MTRRDCSCPLRGFPSRDVARRVHHRAARGNPSRRPVYFKRGPCGLWHIYPRTKEETQ